jgi:UDP-2,3-diacylglucosamine pyrophosphatase LpxH
MELLTHNVPADWTLYDMGDLHVGSTAFHEDAFLEAREEIATSENARLVLGGDLIECIAVDDFRFQVEATDLNMTEAGAQAKRIIELMTPIKDKIVVSLEGNHEFKIRKHMKIMEHICHALEIPYGTFTCKITYRDKHGVQFKHYTTHGFRSIGSTAADPVVREANVKKQNKDKLKGKCADAYLMTRHHNHKLILSEPNHELFLTDNGSKIKQNYTEAKQNAKYIPPDLRWYGCAGSFSRLYPHMGVSGYAERFELDPTEIGYLKFQIRDRKLVNGERVVI